MWKKIKFNNKLGFSLVEAMVGMGLMTAVGVGVMQMQSQQVKSQKNIDADYEIKTLTSAVYNQLKNKDACEQTFAGMDLAHDEKTLNEIKDESGNVLFRSTMANGGTTPELFKGQNDIEIYQYIVDPMNFAETGDGITRVGTVRVGIEYRKANNLLNNNNLYRRYLSLPIRVKYDISSGAFNSCVSSADDIMLTSLKKFCESLMGDYDDGNAYCGLSMLDIVRADPLPAFEGVSSANLIEKIVPTDLDPVYVRKGIPATLNENLIVEGSIVLEQEPSGELDAVSKAYFDARVRCPSGQIGVMTNEGIKCSDFRCNPPGSTVQRYFVGINTSGQPVCHNLFSDGGDCEDGSGSLQVHTDGSVQYACCTPTCTNNANVCAGDQYTSSNGCGLCTGTKPVTDATWSAWTDTGETRDISACVNDQIQTEKKQTRTCNGTAQCGGANCSGSDEQWVPGTPKACSTESGWACQPAQTRQESSGSLWGYATNIRMDGMNWKQERPSWPVVVPNGNSWQQGNHAGCIESCRAYAKTQYASDITSVSGEDRMSDSKKTLTIGIIDVFFQEHSGYNQGPPYHDNDNSGFWCGCMMKTHTKGQALTYSDYSMSKSSVDSKIEQATVCTLNGEGGTPIGNPNPPTCTPSKTCVQIKAEVCSDETIYKQDECGNTCSGSGTKYCAPTGGCGARLGQMGSNYACCPDGYNSQGYGYMVEDLGSLDLWYLPNDPPGAFQCMRMYTAP